MALDYEKVFKELEKELVAGSKWTKRQIEECEKEYDENKHFGSKHDRLWYLGGAEWAYEYLLNFTEGLKNNPRLQKED